MSSARCGENSEVVMDATLGTPLKRRHTQSGTHHYEGHPIKNETFSVAE